MFATLNIQRVYWLTHARSWKIYFHNDIEGQLHEDGEWEGRFLDCQTGEWIERRSQ